MTNRKEYLNGKLKNVKYISFDSKCNKRWCFIPFNGNGKAICRRYELGACTEEKLKNPVDAQPEEKTILSKGKRAEK